MSETKKNKLIEFLKLTGYRVLKVDRDCVCVINLVGVPSLFSFKSLNKELKQNENKGVNNV